MGGGTIRPQDTGQLFLGGTLIIHSISNDTYSDIHITFFQSCWLFFTELSATVPPRTSPRDLQLLQAVTRVKASGDLRLLPAQSHPGEGPDSKDHRGGIEGLLHWAEHKQWDDSMFFVYETKNFHFISLDGDFYCYMEILDEFEAGNRSCSNCKVACKWVTTKELPMRINLRPSIYFLFQWNTVYKWHYGFNLAVQPILGEHSSPKIICRKKTTYNFCTYVIHSWSCFKVNTNRQLFHVG